MSNGADDVVCSVRINRPLSNTKGEQVAEKHLPDIYLRTENSFLSVSIREETDDDLVGYGVTLVGKASSQGTASHHGGPVIVALGAFTAQHADGTAAVEDYAHGFCANGATINYTAMTPVDDTICTLTVDTIPTELRGKPWRAMELDKTLAAYRILADNRDGDIKVGDVLKVNFFRAPVDAGISKNVLSIGPYSGHCSLHGELKTSDLALAR